MSSNEKSNAVRSGTIRCIDGGDVDTNTMSVIPGRPVTFDEFRLGNGGHYVIGRHADADLRLAHHPGVSGAAVVIRNYGGELFVAVDNLSGAVLQRSNYQAERIPARDDREGPAAMHALVHRSVVTLTVSDGDDEEAATDAKSDQRPRARPSHRIHVQIDLRLDEKPDPFADVVFAAGERTEEVDAEVAALLRALDEADMQLITAACIDWAWPPPFGIQHPTIPEQVLLMLRATCPSWFDGRTARYSADNLRETYKSLYNRIERVEEQLNMPHHERLLPAIDRAVGTNSPTSAALAQWAHRVGLLDHVDPDLARRMAEIREVAADDLLERKIRGGKAAASRLRDADGADRN